MPHKRLPDFVISSRFVLAFTRAMAPEELWQKFGPFFAGAVFGAAWWTWADAVVCSKQTVPFLHYLPGIGASFAALMFNAVRREELQDYSPFDDGSGCRSRTWLFLAYVIAFISLAASAGLLIQDSANVTALNPDAWWPGGAGVVQTIFILGSGLMYWLSRSQGMDYF